MESASSSARRSLRELKTKLSDLHERHQIRQKPSGFGFVLGDRIDFLDPVRWDALTEGHSFFLQRSTLRVMEQHGPDNIEPRYVMIFRGEKPVAAMALQIVTVTGDHLRRDPVIAAAAPKPGLLRRIMAPAARKAGSTIKERMLVAGNLLSWGFHGIAFAPDEHPAEIWPAVAEAVYRLRRSERLNGSVDLAMVKDITGHQGSLEALRRFSYRPLETEPNMVLALDAAWTTYDHYLAALDSKYRKKVKDQAKKLVAAGCTFETISDLTPHSTRLHDLYLGVQGNASVRLVTLREGYLAALAAASGQNFRCTVLRREGQVIGFVTCVRDGDTAIGYYIGFDRSALTEGLPIYFQLLQTTIADAIAWRCKRLSLGRTALEPKANLGARPEPMTVWVRHRLPPMNWLLRGLLGAVPHSEAPERSPFKTTPAV
jgi:hypothetical protein